MKIVVDDASKPVDHVHIRLKSANANYKLIMKPLDPMYEGYPIAEPNTAMIILEDTYEINSLITMLQTFKDNNWRYFGDWRMYE